jgi:uncharacterized protein
VPIDPVSPRGRGRTAPPAIGIAFEGRPEGFLEAVAPHVDAIEVVPDCIATRDGVRPSIAILDELDRYAPHHLLTYHGIGLSLGTVTGWNEEYLRLLERLLEWRQPAWHSEHLGFSIVDGHFLGTMPALPTSTEAAELITERALRLRELFGLDVMLEHVANPLPRPGELSLAAFLNQIGRGAGCRLLLDLHNLECDVDNRLLVLDDFVAELDWSLVGEVHVAGGIWRDGFHLDVHSETAAPSTLALLRDVLRRASRLELVVFEVLAEAVPHLGVERVTGQLATLAGIVRGAGADAAA